MKDIKQILVGAILALGLTGAGALMAQTPGNPYGVCIPATGDGTTISISGTSASATLERGAVYEANCDTDVYETFANGTSATATSNSQPRASGTWYFGTPTSQQRTVAYIQQSASGTCELRQCL